MKRFFSGPDHRSRLPFSSMTAVWTLSLWLLWACHGLAAETIRVGVYDNPPKVFLTQNGVAAGIYPEEQWIREHPVIRIAIDPHFSPFEFLSKQGTFTGMAADYLALISQKTGLKFQRIDLGTWDEALIALSKGKIDIVIGNLAVAQHAIKELSLVNLKFAGYAAPEPQSLSMGVRKDWPEFVTILNKALTSVSFREKSRILSKWFPLPTEAYNNIGLTREEREWLLLNPRIKVAWDRHWAPIEFADENGVDTLNRMMQSLLDIFNLESNELPLAFCKLAVEAHGGSIQVDSRQGEGSIFSFTLPDKPQTNGTSHA